MISVVIPYYQREPGILRRALASIAAQRDCPLPIHVIVVDDASPAPAASEVESVDLPCTVQVVAQANGGPGAARNAGLDHAPSGTRFIALLDSDDEWTPSHLQRAVCALESGFQFYFADHFQLGQTVGAFERAGRIVAAEHPALPLPLANLHAYRDDMIDQIIRGNVIGTSTVVYDHRAFPQQRFRVELTNAGEDYLFWMELARQGATFCFSSVVEATYGRGVNVYSGATWGSEQLLLRIHHELTFRKAVCREFDLTSDQSDMLREQVAALRGAFARSLLHRLTHLKRTSTRLLFDHLKLDPASYARVPACAWSSLSARWTS